MSYSLDPARNRAVNHGEAIKVRWAVLEYTQGTGLDLGCGPHKLWPSSLGVDSHPAKGLNFVADVTRLGIIATGSMDYVFSSHCLEDLQDTVGALAEWWRTLKVGGHLVLYLPHAEHYPRIGTPEGNPAHQHDFLPDDIFPAMEEAAPDWTLLVDEDRTAGDEYSFLQVYRKEEDGHGQRVQLDEIAPQDKAIVIRHGGFGDVIVAASTFPGLKALGYHVTVYTGAKGAEVIRHDPSVDKIVVHDLADLNHGLMLELCAYLRTQCGRFINFAGSFEHLLLANPSREVFWWPHAARHRYMDGNYQEAAAEVAGVHVGAQQFHPTAVEEAVALRWRDGIPTLVCVAATGTGVNKMWPHLFEYVGRLVMRNPGVHVAVLGELHGAQVLEHDRIHSIGQDWTVRDALTLATVADLVIGPETGILNAVASLALPKIVLLSHSSEHNLTKHWQNTHCLKGEVACYPCHRLHPDWRGCTKDPETDFAACASAIEPMTAIELTERLLNLTPTLLPPG